MGADKDVVHYGVSSFLGMWKWKKHMNDIYATLKKEKAYRRLFKDVLATGISIAIALLPNVQNSYGIVAYIGAMTCVFVLGSPGRKLGGMLEAAGTALVGTFVGVGWMSLGVWLGSLIHLQNPDAALGIRAVFLAISMFVHGYVRSNTPRLFIAVLIMAIPTLLGLTRPVLEYSKDYVTMFLYPMLTAIASLLVVNVCIFPEFGTSNLGSSTIETLRLTMKILADSTEFFVESCGHDPNHVMSGARNKAKPKIIRLVDLTSSKPVLRAKIAECKGVYRDSAYDISFACLAPKELKIITGRGLSRLGNNVAALVGLCESKYSLMGTLEYRVDEGPEENPEISQVDGDGDAEKPQTKAETQPGYVPRLKVKRAIEYGDEQLLRQLLRMVAEPVNALKYRLMYTVDIINFCIGHAYEVPEMVTLQMPEGKFFTPCGILLQELDIYIDALAEAIEEFANSSTHALEGADVYDHTGGGDVDILPRDEIFLISSFMLNVRLAATQTLLMIKHARQLIEMRQGQKNIKTFHWPDVSLKKWLYSGTEETEAMNLSGGVPQFGGAPHDEDEDDEGQEEISRESGDRIQWNNGQSRDTEAQGQVSETAQEAEDSKARKDRKDRKQNAATGEKIRQPWGSYLRGGIANFVDWIRHSDNFIYATKFAFGMLLLSWPAFVNAWSLWYHHARAVWVAFIFILTFENAVGSTVWIFFLRAVGTILGSTWGYAAYQAGKRHTVIMGVMLVIGSIPGYYVQRNTRFLKAAMVCTVSMCVVAISTHLQTVPGTSFENFYKRTSASLIGGSVALLVQLVLFPVKARNKLKEQTAKAIAEINHMVQCVALGVDVSHTHMLHHPRFLQRFERAGKAASNALTAAEAFLEYTKFESRMKGRFDGHRVVYAEILFVLRQIVDRLENLLRLRIAFGSAIIEEFNSRVRPYRRNVLAALTLTLYGISESLIQKLPLPQFLPSARLAHLRLVVRVRQIVHDEAVSTATAANVSHMHILSRQRGEFQGNTTPVSNIANSGSESDEKQVELEATQPSGAQSSSVHSTTTIDEGAKGASAIRQNALRLKILSWNASSAAMEECVEYVEELVELAKMLVGVTEFRSGLLHRPTFKEYLRDMNRMQSEMDEGTAGGASLTGNRNRSSKMQSTIPLRGGQSVVGSTGGADAISSRAQGGDRRESTAGVGEDQQDGVRQEEEDAEMYGDYMAGGGDAVLPPPLIRIQTRREAERFKRKKE